MTTPNQFAGILSGWQFVRNHSRPLQSLATVFGCLPFMTPPTWLEVPTAPKGFDETDILIPGRIELVIIIVIRIMMRGDSPYICIDDEKVVEPEKVKGTAPTTTACLYSQPDTKLGHPCSYVNLNVPKSVGGGGFRKKGLCNKEQADIS